MDGGPGMRLPNTAHTSRPWRIHELTPDFRVEDVWALPGTGRPDDFPRLVQGFASGDPSQSSSGAARTLWAIRWKLGEMLGWDGPDAGPGSGVPTLRDRLPADLRDAPSGPDFDVLPFASLYLLDDEWAAEIANRTMHGVMHIGLVPNQTGGYRAQMAVLVKPNGLFGTAYMAAIRPFRYLIVYPAMMRQIEREWRARGDEPTPGIGTEVATHRTPLRRGVRDPHKSRAGWARGRALSPVTIDQLRRQIQRRLTVASGRTGQDLTADVRRGRSRSRRRCLEGRPPEAPRLLSQPQGESRDDRAGRSHRAQCSGPGRDR